MGVKRRQQAERGGGDMSELPLSKGAELAGRTRGSENRLEKCGVVHLIDRDILQGVARGVWAGLGGRMGDMSFCSLGAEMRRARFRNAMCRVGRVQKGD